MRIPVALSIAKEATRGATAVRHARHGGWAALQRARKSRKATTIRRPQVRTWAKVLRARNVITIRDPQVEACGWPDKDAPRTRKAHVMKHVSRRQ